MIELKHVERFYPLAKGQFFYVLRDINLKINEGDFVSIMGPSGAGKSSLLHVLGMHDHAWSGEYHLRRQRVHSLKPKDRATLRNEKIGFVFQQYHLLDDLTVYENLDIPLSYRHMSKSDRAAKVADTLDRFHIVGKKDLYPRQLSGGQQQLVGVARAIISDPKLILADEPTGNLHSSSGRRNHGAVQAIEQRRHHNRAGHALREERHLRQPRRPTARRLRRVTNSLSLSNYDHSST